ncbi:septum formation family protein [Cellulomonas chengniuliangii]|uniref:Septum formation family protein n=1 Tax=Cellulomonas chengniuliangii TaxID=2968084 RepID=A0ABY5L036_9CELL|nr:septum formation family protein [Cellulomonas chengniuliangii]MCC2308628.1 septum formation family protein [Cellulomonas chengniuliangii]UUI73988.1 septum formation family protein [Cellulomonas chengniuliangii]
MVITDESMAVGIDRRRSRRAAAVASGLLVAPVLGGCAWFGDGGDTGDTVDVFDLEVGDCLRAPTEITAELTAVERVACEHEHTLEVFAVTGYEPADAEFPGDAQLQTYADGTCVAEFERYVGVDYRDSKLFFTYLLPSARGWSQGEDRDITCLVTTTGAQLTASVRGSQV